MVGKERLKSFDEKLPTLHAKIFSARKKQAEKLKKMTSVKADSCETDSVAEDGTCNETCNMAITAVVPVYESVNFIMEI